MTLGIMSNSESCRGQEDSPSSSQAPSSDHRPTYLFAFDFDHTVVNDNSDCVITSLAKCPVPPEVKKFYDGTNWTEYMNKIFQFLHDQGVSVQDICDLVRRMEGTKGVVPLLQTLVDIKTIATENIHLLIISDANDLFISEFLKAQVLNSTTLNLNDPSTVHGPKHYFPFDIITNPAKKPTSAQNSLSDEKCSGPMNNNCDNSNPITSPSSTSVLQISPYENQSSCKICPKNLCKGAALQSYVQKKGPFTKIFYTGDGGNDVCPSLRLSQSDYVFVRKDHAMHKRLIKSENNLGISANIVIWNDGSEVKTVMEQFLQRLR